MSAQQKITTFLWFNDEAEEAVNFYTSIFKDSKILNVMRNGEGGYGTPGSVLTITFQLAGQEYNALNGGPHFKFTEAISLMVHCDDQAEVDRLWSQLNADPDGGQCGWLKDKFGLSWQIVPSAFFKLVSDPDPEKSKRVMAAMMKMKKMDVAALQRAYDNQ